MNARPYAAARRTRSIGDKLFEVNWGLVMLIALTSVVLRERHRSRLSW